MTKDLTSMVLQNQEMLEAIIKCAHINDHL